MDFNITQQEGIQLTGLLIASTVVVEYTAMPYEQPANNGCFLSIWQESQIPFGEPGDHTKIVMGNERTGSQVFDRLTSNLPYIVGWGAGNKPGTTDPSYGSIGSSILFTHGGETDSSGIVTEVSEQVIITPTLVDKNYIMVTFDTLGGNNPSENKNWIGLWQGSAIDFDGGYLEKWSVTSTDTSGAQGLNIRQAIRTGSTYTLAYASGPNKSDVVACATFKV